MTTETMAEATGRRIRDHRQGFHWSQEELGRKLGEAGGRAWPKQVVSKVEQGKRECSASELAALAILFKAPVGIFLLPYEDTLQLEGGAEVPTAALLPSLGQEVLDWDLDRLEVERIDLLAQVERLRQAAAETRERPRSKSQSEEE